MNRLKAEFAKRESQIKGFTTLIYAAILMATLVSMTLIVLGISLIIAVLKTAGLM